MKAVLVGDTIRPVIVPVSKRESKSRPGAGIVNYEMKVYNQNDELVFTKEFAMMLADSYETARKYALVTL